VTKDDQKSHFAQSNATATAPIAKTLTKLSSTTVVQLWHAFWKTLPKLYQNFTEFNRLRICFP
jgi:hypothetical protein